MKLNQTQLEQLIKDTTLDHKGKNLNGRCPQCGEMEFGISLADNHLFNCYRKKKCGFSGNIYTLLKFLGRTKEFLSEREINVFKKLESNLIQQEEVLVFDLPNIHPPILWKRVYEDQYLYERGFEQYQFEKFEVGRSRFSPDYVTFLVRQNGEIKGYLSRSERSKEWIDQYNSIHKIPYPRYNNSESDFAKMLFGLDEIVPNVTQDVILVEGVFSKTKTDVNLGLDYQDQVKCVATFGAKLSAHQIQLLKMKSVKRLIFWFEADVLNKIKPIIANAALHFDIKACYLQDKDPNNLSSDEAFELLERAVGWFNFNTNYIQSSLKE